MATDSDSKTEDGQGSDERTYSKAEFEDVVAARQKAKKDRDELASQLAEIREWKEAKEREELERKGQYDEALKTAKADFEKKMADLLRENEGLKTTQEQQAKNQRMQKFVEAIATKAGLPQPTIRAALRELNAERGVDIAPEEFNDDTIADVITQAKDSVPGLFNTRDMGQKPGSQEAKSAKDKQLEDAVAKLNAHSTHANYKRAFGALKQS